MSAMMIRNYEFNNSINNATLTITIRSENGEGVDDVEAQSILEEMVDTPEIWWLENVDEEAY
jgi:hypothetical protein